MRQRNVVNVQRSRENLAYYRRLATRPVDGILVTRREGERAPRRKPCTLRRTRGCRYAGCPEGISAWGLAACGRRQLHEQVVAALPANRVPVVGSHEPADQGECARNAAEDLLGSAGQLRRNVERKVHMQPSPLGDEFHHRPQDVLALLEDLLAELDRRNTAGPGQSAGRESLFVGGVRKDVEHTGSGRNAGPPMVDWIQSRSSSCATKLLEPPLACDEPIAPIALEGAVDCPGPPTQASRKRSAASVPDPKPRRGRRRTLRT